MLTLALTVLPAAPGVAAISFRSSHSAANAVSTTLVIDTPAGVVVGDVLLATVSVRGAPTITKPGGWTPVRTNASGTAIKQAIYRRVATAAEPASYVWTFGAAKAASGGIVAYAGVDAVSPVVASSGGANASSMSITAPSVDTGVDDTVVVGFFGVRIAGTIAPPIDMAERFDVAGSGAAATVSAADVVQPAAGPTGIKVATASSAGVGIGQLVVLRPADGPPSGNAPTAIARRASTFEGRPVSIELSARDEEQCELTFSIASAPSSGSVGPITNYVCKQGTPNSDKGSVTYVPTGGFVGTDTFTYRASDGSSESNAATVTIEVKLPPVSVVPVDETPPVAGSGDVADDPAIWVHPTDPSLSLVIGTSKHLTAGGLYVYDLDGMELQYLPTGSPNNVDLRYGFTLNGQSIDLVAAANKGTNAIDLYKVNVATRLLESVGSVSSSVPAMAGFCMYHSPTGKFYAIGNHSNGVMEQFELDGSGPTVTGTVIRSFDVGSATEGCAADDELGHLYISEEIQALWKYGAEPDDGSVRVKVEPVGGGSHIVSDAEGIAIYYRSGGAGYLIVSSQGDSSYAVFDREGTNAYVGSFETADGISVDRTTETDGLEVTNVALGSLFPQGLLVLHDHANAGGSTSNFKFVRWDDVAAGLELTVDTNHDPRG